MGGLFINGRYVCHQCGTSYAHSHNMKQHLKYECMKPPRFFCDHCSYKTKRKYDLQKHCLVRHANLIKFGLGKNQ